MSDDQAFRFALSALFNSPSVVLSVVYVAMTALSYRRRRDSRALRAFLMAIALLAAVLSFVAVSLGLIAVTDARLPQLVRTLVFGFRVVVFSVLVTVVWVWWRNERRRD